MNKFKESVQRILSKFKMQDYKEETPISDMEAYKEKVLRVRHVTYLRLLVLTAVVVGGAFWAKYLVDHQSYSSYVVEETSKKTDSSATQYLEMQGKLLRYSGDGASLSSAANETIWNDSFQMTTPALDTFDTTIVIYDQEGTLIELYNDKQKLGAFQTEYPILKASVSANGSVAVLLDNSENTLMNYYTSSGSLIASSSTNMKNPGYPVDLAVSEDGMYVAVSYFVPGGDTISSYLAFYNFGEEGKKNEDNLVSGFRYEGILVPKVEYVDDQTMIAYREDGFTIYKGKTKPEEVKTVTFESEIVSSFASGDYLGFVFLSGASEHPFSMKLYKTNGSLQMEKSFDLIYDEIKISGNHIIINNTSELRIFSLKGIERYAGHIEEGNIAEVVKTGMNRYLVAYNGGVMSIRLK